MAVFRMAAFRAAHLLTIGTPGSMNIATRYRPPRLSAVLRSSLPVRSTGGVASSETIVIEPQPAWRFLNLRELWTARALIGLLVWRDIKVRYKQTLLGIGWVVVQPLLTTGVFALVFSLLMGEGNQPGVPSVPYAVSTFCAMLPWQLFARAMGQAGTSLVSNRALITKVYFPRLVLPLAATLAALADGVVVLGALLLMMGGHRLLPGAQVLLLPLFTLLVLSTALGAGLWLAAFSAMFRDFQNLMPLAIRLGMLISPVAYSMQSMQDRLSASAKLIYCLNPMVAAIEGFRWALLGQGVVTVQVVVPAALTSTVLLLTGIVYFRHTERMVTDIV